MPGPNDSGSSLQNASRELAEFARRVQEASKSTAERVRESKREDSERRKQRKQALRRGGLALLGAGAFLGRAAAEANRLGDLSQFDDVITASVARVISGATGVAANQQAGNAFAAKQLEQLTVRAAQAGATIDPSVRENLFELFAQQGTKGAEELNQIKILQKTADTLAVANDPTVGAALDKLVELGVGIKNALDGLPGFGGGR